MWPFRNLDPRTGPHTVGGLQPEYTSFPPLSEWSLLAAPSSALLYVLMFSLNCFQATIFVKTNNECDNSSVDNGELTQRPLWTVLVSTNNSASGWGCPDNKVLLLAWIKPSLLDVYTTFCIKAELALMGLVVEPSTTTWVGKPPTSPTPLHPLAMSCHPSLIHHIIILVFNLGKLIETNTGSDAIFWRLLFYLQLFTQLQVVISWHFDAQIEIRIVCNENQIFAPIWRRGKK